MSNAECAFRGDVVAQGRTRHGQTVPVWRCLLGGHCAPMRLPGVRQCEGGPDRPPVTWLVVTYIRHVAVKRCVESILWWYPQDKVVVAEQTYGQRPDPIPPELAALERLPNVRILWLPRDCGLSRCRNEAVRAAQTQLVCLLDDDMVVTKETDIAAMWDVMRESGAEIVYGACRSERGVTCWLGYLREQAGRLWISAPHPRYRVTCQGTRWQETHVGLNWFLARKDVLLRVPWDDRIKIVGEHVDHSVRLRRAGVRCAYTPDSIVVHHRLRVPGYGEQRGRGESLAYVQRKLGVAPYLPREQVEYGTEPRPLWPLMELPCIVLLTAGHTGSSVVAAMLHALGWHLPEPSDPWREGEELRQLNIAARSGRWDPGAAERFLRSLPKPWVLKDPRFCETWRRWLPLLWPYQPVLLWLRRRGADVVASYARRGEPVKLAQERLRTVARIAASWPWRVLPLDYEHLDAAITLWRHSPEPGCDGVAS